ncbi:PREDICTED: interferon lambda-3-like isoform X1 [Propithecus coquereli]|uniref:interferon lambda-3-like isoform X1 n=2 Tax=Propithecus coquereli TaxID=379532 RepID=UPI00063F0117|nr:PREDICTED: interferon lambda-3-like isoform X1 [Propithecus coquereli]
MKLDMAAGCMPVLVLMAVALTRTAAIPVTRHLRAVSDARGCHIAQFKSLSPKELQAFKMAKDALEESLLLRDRRCGSRPFPRPWDLRQLQVWERPVALDAELALTLKVLGAVADTALGDVLDQPLRTLRHIRSQLQACGPAQPTAGPRPRGRLQHWLHRLQEAPRKESPGCLEASVTFNLFRLLTRDLKCVASGHHCA